LAAVVAVAAEERGEGEMWEGKEKEKKETMEEETMEEEKREEEKRKYRKRQKEPKGSQCHSEEQNGHHWATPSKWLAAFA